MRFLKAQRTSRGINSDTKGLNIDALGLAEINTDAAVIVPKGDQNKRPFVPAEGMLRYNTDTSDFEVYQNAAWKPVRFREPTTIVQQNLGNGDGTETTFGPLNSGDTYYPVPISENNILVTIEFNLSVSLIIIFKNFEENLSFNFLFKICALPLIPDNGFFTSCAKVRARFAAIFCVEKVFVESIILLRLSTHKISNIKQLKSLLHETVRSITLLLFEDVVNSKSLFVVAPSFSTVFFNKLISFPLVSSEN